MATELKQVTWKELSLYLKRLDVEIRTKWFWKLAILGIVLFVFSMKFSFSINLSYSLPGKLYLIVKKPDYIKVGDIVSYKYFGHLYPKRAPFLKIVEGAFGDVVSEKNREFFVNGKSVGVAKERSLGGRSLSANSFRGTIPPGKLWVGTPSVDSLDSRYEDNGLISEGQVVGKAYLLW